MKFYFSSHLYLLSRFAVSVSCCTNAQAQRFHLSYLARLAASKVSTRNVHGQKQGFNTAWYFNYRLYLSTTPWEVATHRVTALSHLTPPVGILITQIVVFVATDWFPSFLMLVCQRLADYSHCFNHGLPNSSPTNSYSSLLNPQLCKICS